MAKQDKYCKALEKTFQSYEKLIRDPLGEIEKWRNYGDGEHCRLCKVVDSECFSCPISIQDKEFLPFLAYSCGNDKGNGNFYNMCRAIRELIDCTYNPVVGASIDDAVADLRRAARARLRNLIKVAESKGYEYK